MNPEKISWVAVDVAKKSLQVLIADRSLRFKNDGPGIENLIEMILKLDQPWVVCEATGGYERTLLRKCFQKAITVSLANPQRVRAFANSDGVKAKTDPIDVKVIRDFAISKAMAGKLRPTEAPNAIREEMHSLLDRRAQLSATLTREKNRMEKEPLYTRELIAESIDFLRSQIEKIDARFIELIKGDPQCEIDCDRLTEIKGVGNLTAWTVLTYLPEIRDISRSKLSSLAGLAPFNFDTGDYCGKRHIYGGRAKVRRCLYMAAQSAAQHNEVINKYVAGLVKRGKPYKCALVAAMRKILICMQSLLKNPDFVLE